MKQKPLTVTFHIGGKQVEKLTAEQAEKIAERLSESLSTYYTSHQDEFKKMKS